MLQDIWGLVGLWRLRAVCRSFRSWSTAQLCLLPRVAALGGFLPAVQSSTPEVSLGTAAVDRPMGSSVELLDLATMSWEKRGGPLPPDAVPFAALEPLPPAVAVAGGTASLDWSCCSVASSCLSAGDDQSQAQAQRVVAVVRSVQAGETFGRQPSTRAGIHALEWGVHNPRERATWRALPELPSAPMATQEGEIKNVAVPPTVCCLRDGRALLIGAAGSSSPVQPMLVLAADRSSWSPEDSSLPYLLL